MKEGKIFLVSQEGENLIPMIETAYSAEDTLQSLLVQYPDLLPGDQINPESPRRWLLVAREMGVPGAEFETGRWSLDHLFLDQDGVPTFVECKRSSDTRGRREVVAQMLDYAANGTQYWGMDRLRQAAAETAERQGEVLDEQVKVLLEGGEDADVEGYWSGVEENLQNGRVRLIFVADETAAELRRLVEFLNEKMRDVEVLAVEVRQFKGTSQTALVSRLVGATEMARRQKSSGARARTNRSEFLSRLPTGQAELFSWVLDKGLERGHQVYWGKEGFSIRVFLQEHEYRSSFMYGWPSGQLQFYFGQLPLVDQEAQTLRERLMAYGIFVPSGQKTLTVSVADVPESRIREMVDFVLDEVDDISRRY